MHEKLAGSLEGGMATWGHADEQERLLTVDAANVSMAHEFEDKEYLINLCKEEENLYKNDWPNGNDFVLEFPDKINTFIESYCDEV